ncbi:MAG: hypothetical protein WC756_17745 [Taibaiella sp.]|jgi:hypothetical protein
MTLHQLAIAIPKEYRDQIIDENMIYKAIGASTDRHMRILFTIWSQYVDPHGDNDMGCPACINNILNNFKQLEPILIDIRKQEQILDSI